MPSTTVVSRVKRIAIFNSLRSIKNLSSGSGQAQPG
jgi:hypothetical protein